MLINLGCDIFYEDDETISPNPLTSDDYICIGKIGNFLGNEYPYYRYWIFVCKNRLKDQKYYAFWDVGNGHWSGEYFVVDDFTQLQKEIQEDAERFNEDDAY